MARIPAQRFRLDSFLPAADATAGARPPPHTFGSPVIRTCKKPIREVNLLVALFLSGDVLNKVRANVLPRPTPNALGSPVVGACARVIRG